MKGYVSYVGNLLKSYRTEMVRYSFLALIAAVLSTLGPALLGRGLDGIAKGGAPVSFLLIGGWFLAGILADRIRSRVARRGDEIGMKVAAPALVDQVTKIIEKPLSFHHEQRSHEFTGKIINLFWHTIGFVQSMVFDSFPALLSLVCIVVYLCIINPLIGVVLLGASVVFIWYTQYALKTWLPLRDAWLEKTSELGRPGWEALANILVIKSTHNESRIKKEFAEKTDELFLKDRELAENNERFLSTQNLIGSTGTGLIVFIAVAQFSSGRVSFGDLTAITAYAFAAFGYIKYAQWQLIQLLKGQSLFAEIKKLLDAPAEDYLSGESLDISGSIVFQKVSFGYSEDRKILKNISFEIPEGSKVAFVGESGEGKSTLVNLIGRYYAPVKGRVLIDRTPVENINLGSLRSQMAYVPQDITLLHDTIGGNIRYGRQDATDKEVEEAARKAALHDFIRKLPDGYKTMVGERGLKLSGGERQRVSLARAFLRDPKILILDEPTSNLDSKTEAEIQKALQLLMRGRTTIIIAHRLHTIRSVDTIFVVEGGTIVESGTHAELLARKGSYARLIELQADRFEV